MCCFSRAVEHVSATRIFARRLGDGTQALVYSMSVSIGTDLAMVLPIPVPAGTGEDGVRFLDLSGYPAFFDDLKTAFPGLGMLAAKGPALRFGPPAVVQKLVVHQVGDFEASFVPSRADFERLDERFRLDPSVWDRLPGYADYGFAVFKLKPKRSLLGVVQEQKVHPMAFVFPSREPDALYFPTVHVHDGTVPSVARFDHTFFAQDDGVLGATIGWTKSFGPIGAYVDASRSSGLVIPERNGFGEMCFRDHPNEDLWLRPPEGLSVEDLTGRGECHAFAVRATAAYPLTAAGGHRFAAWQASAKKSHAFAKEFRAALVEFEATHRDELRLTPLEPSLRPHFINGTQLWTGTSYMDGQRGHDGGSGFVTFRPFTDRVECQDVVLGFSVLPDEATTDRIHGLLADLLERCAARP